jgi:hypothetical protein
VGEGSHGADPAGEGRRVAGGAREAAGRQGRPGGWWLGEDGRVGRDWGAGLDPPSLGGTGPRPAVVPARPQAVLPAWSGPGRPAPAPCFFFVGCFC